jgi:hypothetical protein
MRQGYLRRSSNKRGHTKDKAKIVNLSWHDACERNLIHYQSRLARSMLPRLIEWIIPKRRPDKLVINVINGIIVQN